MTATALAGIRPERFPAASYRAFRITPVSTNPFTRDQGNHTTPLDIGDVSSLLAAVAAAAVQCIHKDHLAIHETDAAGQVKLHLYAIKRRSAPTYEHDRHHICHRIHNLYPDPICVIGSEALNIPMKEMER